MCDDKGYPDESSLIRNHPSNACAGAFPSVSVSIAGSFDGLIPKKANLI